MSEPSPMVVTLVERFEDAWQAGRPRDVGSFVRAATEAADLQLDPETLRRLTIDLVRIDLEYRWRAWRSRQGGRLAWCLEEYAIRLPEIGTSDQWPEELIVAEYRNRRLWGDRPDLDEFLERFGSRASALLPKLEQAAAAIADLGPREELSALRREALEETDSSPQQCSAQPSRTANCDHDDLSAEKHHRGVPVSDQGDAAPSALDHDRRIDALANPAESQPSPTEPVECASTHVSLIAPTGSDPVDAPQLEAPSSGGWAVSQDTRSLAAREKYRRDRAEPEPELGIFGDYELLEEVGQGGMGVVYKARQIELNRIVALKMIRSEGVSRATVLQRFRIEAEIAGGLDHQFIVPVFQVGRHAGRDFYAMGFVEGSSLAERVASGPLPQANAVELAWQISEAIAYAHSKGVIHRDLKPANVLIDANGHPKVTDFGLAKVVKTESALTLTGEILGTPSYMAPEQAAGRTQEIAQPADIYALGAILYCLLTGRPPFQGPSTVETLSQVLNDDPVSPRRLQPKTDRDVETICLKCLAKPPERRYATAQDLADDLRRFLDHQPIRARPPRLNYRLRKFVRRHRVEASTLAGSLAVCVAILLLAAWAFRAEQVRRMDSLIAKGYEQLDRAVAADGTV
jgi:tRNA A-37 threonylcarbamoyl transferase component Bud32